MRILSIDHIVLVVREVAKTCEFYEHVLGMAAVEEHPGRWSLKFGSNKISLQQEGAVPAIARQTLRGTGNFCLLTQSSMEEVVEKLQQLEIAIVEGPVARRGATGPIMSVYFYDLDGNLVELANPL